MTLTTEYFQTTLAQEIWEKKYKGNYGDPLTYYLDLAERVALGSTALEERFRYLLTDFRFSPGGRILAWAGRPTAKVSLMNCTTHAVEGDSLGDIARTAHVIMLASSHGQGIGIDLSKLRPLGAPVDNAAKTSTGSISFMEWLNHTGGVIGQNGRRAALLFSMRDNHPDLWRDSVDVPCSTCGGKGCFRCQGKGGYAYDFLNVKRIPGRVENANISVMITDAFMEAVQKDLPWDLEYAGESGGETFHVKRTVQARDLFHALARSAWASAEPGVLFWDTSQRMSNSDIFGDAWAITGCNACSEQVLDQDGVCNLGSMNLARYVVNPFTASAHFDYKAFAWDAQAAVHFLDNVLDIELADNRSITERQRQSVEMLRRVGLGAMGLADALAMMGLRYAANEATTRFVHAVFRTLRDSVYDKSIQLAKQKGACGVWANTTRAQRKELVEQGFYATLPKYHKKEIVEHGLRNALLLSIAPTGTISNLYGVASGIEPIFARSYTRKIRVSGYDEVVEVVHPGVQLSRAMGVDDSVWQTAYEVLPRDHVLIQAAVQQYVDAAVSKTVNLPMMASVEDVEAVYMLAWEEGLKGITVYRDASRNEQVLTSLDEKADGEVSDGSTCPECGGTLIKQDGCEKCPSCGSSKCG
jgi:ribonucleoside-diphosphate reductase alpha chain